MSLLGWIVIIGLVIAFAFLVVSWLIAGKEDKNGIDD